MDETDFAGLSRDAIEADMAQAAAAPKKGAKKGTSESVSKIMRKAQNAKASPSGWVTDGTQSEGDGLFSEPEPSVSFKQAEPQPQPRQSKKREAQAHAAAAYEEEIRKKRELLKEYDKLADRYGLKKEKLDVVNDLWIIEKELEKVQSQIAVAKGHGLIKESVMTIGDVAEQLSEAYPGYINLRGYKAALQQSGPRLDAIIAELCVKYAYLFTEIKPEYQLGFLMVTTAMAVHGANTNSHLAERIQLSERARSRGGEKAPASMSQDFSTL